MTPRLQDLAILLESSDVEIFGVGELVRWQSKPSDPLGTQTHEPKMKVAPRGGVMVLKAKVTIELADEFAEPPTWRASCRCLPPSLLRETLSIRVCRYTTTNMTFCDVYCVTIELFVAMAAWFVTFCIGH